MEIPGYIVAIFIIFVILAWTTNAMTAAMTISTISVLMYFNQPIEGMTDESDKINVTYPDFSQNSNTLDDILNPYKATADDNLSTALLRSGKKNKIAQDIRTNMNSDTNRYLFDYEFSIHEDNNREWWTDNDFELSVANLI